MVKKINSNSTTDATKSSDKKLDDDNQQPRKARHQKRNNYNKKTTSQSTCVCGTEKLETDTFPYGATMGRNCVNSKEAFIVYTTVKYGTNARESLKNGKTAA